MPVSDPDHPNQGDDFTLIPQQLYSMIEKYDQDGSLRSTVAKGGSEWMRTRQKNLLTPSETEVLREGSIIAEQKMAFDLLDALSRS